MATSPKQGNKRYTEAAQDVEQAGIRFSAACSKDPFPNIPASLLNSADIHDYVIQTGMVHPYDPMKRKSASLSFSCGRNYIYWDKNGKLEDKELADNEEVNLPANSIVFVTTEEKFQLPDYIAARFDLQIEFVHQGLLLGTGPLVDPGFTGRILVPLHNLTNNNYTLRQGEELIWVEFTKISPNSVWDKTQSTVAQTYNLTGDYKNFNPDKRERSAWEYLDRARRNDRDGPVVHNSIQSSIPLTLGKAEDAAISAEENSRKAKKTVKKYWRFSFIGGIAIVAAILGLAYQMISMLRNSDSELLQARIDNTASLTNLEKNLELFIQETGTIYSSKEENLLATRNLNQRITNLLSEIQQLKNSIPSNLLTEITNNLALVEKRISVIEIRLEAVDQ